MTFPFHQPSNGPAHPVSRAPLNAPLYPGDSHPGDAKPPRAPVKEFLMAFGLAALR